MPYIGNDIQFGELTSQTFTGDGSTTAFTLSYTVANPTSLIVTIANVIQEPTTAYTVAGTTLTCTSAPADGDTIHVRFLGRVVDVANAAILQDSDQDTKVQVEESADEDTIRFDVAGTEVATIAASLTAVKNGALTLSGTTPTLTIGDAGAEDTKIVFDGNAQDYYIGIDDAGGELGGDVLTMGNGSTVGSSPAISIDSDEKVTIHTGLAGRLLIGVHDGTHNAKNSRGLTVELGDADNEAVSGKSSDVAHGNTSVAETDTFFTLSKASATAGGLAINGIAEGDRTSNSLIIQGHGNGDSVNATKTANGGDGAIVIMYRGHDGSNGAEDVASDGNILSVGCAISGGGKHKFIIDEDGDIFNDGADSTAYDSYDDAALLRALELWRGEENPDTVKKQLLPSRYDDNRYSKEQLADTKLMQVVSDKDWKAGDRSLVSVTGQVRVTNGAIWQNHEMLDAIIETMEERDSGFTAALKKKFVARGLPTQILDWDGDIPDDLIKPDVAPKAFNAE